MFGGSGAWEGHRRKLIKAALPQGNNSIIFKAPKVIGASNRSAQIQKVAFVQLPVKLEISRKLSCIRVETRDLVSAWLNTSERDKGNKVIQAAGHRVDDQSWESHYASSRRLTLSLIKARDPCLPRITEETQRPQVVIATHGYGGPLRRRLQPCAPPRQFTSPGKYPDVHLASYRAKLVCLLHPHLSKAVQEFRCLP